MSEMTVAALNPETILGAMKQHGVTTDTVATYTERFLMAFGLNYYLIENDADSDRIAVAFAEAERTHRPVVILVGDEYHGFNR